MEQDKPADNVAFGSAPDWLHSKLLKAAVSAALLALLLWRIDLGALWENLSHVHPGLLALGVLTFLVANLVSIFKWYTIVRAQDIRVPYFYLTGLFYIGLFFNNFLPTSFGGDVVRMVKLSRATGRSVEAASSVAMDRATSTVALLVIAAVPAAFELGLLGTRMLILIVAMLAGVLAMVAVLMSERAARRLGRLPLLRLNPMGLRRYFVSFYYSMHALQKNRGLMVTVLAISLAYQCLQVIIVYFIALSLDIDIPVVYYFMFIPIVLAVSMIPFSLNGLGMREGAWVLLFGQVGVSSAAGFSMSILSFLVLTTVSLAGGVFYLFDRVDPAGANDPAGAK